MKLLYIASILFFISINAFGQNYSLLNKEAEAIYNFNENTRINYGYSYSSNHSNDNYWIAANRDRDTIINGDTLLVHASLAKYYDYNSSNNCAIIGDTSWLGNVTIIQPNGDYLFFNRLGDTIKILPQANLNDKWTSFQWSNGNYIEATVFSLNLEIFGNTSDSIKSIIFQVKDAAHQNVVDPFNGFQLRISKNYGMVKSVNFFDFPNDTSSIYLVGHSDLNTNIRNITMEDIYNFDVGDEFHTEGFSQNIPNSIHFSYQSQRILAKSNSGDSLIYHIENRNIYIDRIFSQNADDTIYSVDTTIQVYLTDGSHLLDNVPYGVDTVKYNTGSLFYSPIYTRLEWDATHNNRLTKATMGEHFNLLPCLSSVIDAFHCKKYYIEGLGGNYYDCTSWGNRSTRELVFYKKNTGTWGTPINFQSLIPTSTRTLKSIKSVTLFPNPTTNQITVSTNGEIIKNGQITIFDGLGRVIWTSTVHHFQERKLDVKAWADGIYYVQLQSEDSIWTGRFIKK